MIKLNQYEKEININNIISSVGNKEISYHIFQVLNKVLNGINLSIIEYTDLCSKDLTNILSLIHSNFISYLYNNRIALEETKLINLIKYYKYFIF